MLCIYLMCSGTAVHKYIKSTRLSCYHHYRGQTGSQSSMVGSSRVALTLSLQHFLSLGLTPRNPYSVMSFFKRLSQVNLWQPFTFLLGTYRFLTLLIRDDARSTCPNQRKRFALKTAERTATPSLAHSCSVDELSRGPTLHIQRIMDRSHLFSWSRSVFLVAQVSLPCSIADRTQASYTLPFVVIAKCFEVSIGRSCLNLPHAIPHLLMTASLHPPPALNLSPYRYIIVSI